jgi:pheophorbide a oxygenase
MRQQQQQRGSSLVAGVRNGGRAAAAVACAPLLLPLRAPAAHNAAAAPLHLLHRAPRVSAAAAAAETAVRDAAPTTTTNEDAAGGDKAIDWFKQWYPVAIVSDLDPARPHALTLLGKSLVLWRPNGNSKGKAKGDDAQAKWLAFEDRCPHRLAPLSEGRVDDKTGHLMCSYHGWQFDGRGACTAIPQLPAGDETARSAALGSRRSCVSVYPTREHDGVVWVWADAHSAAEAEAAPMAVIPEGLKPNEWTPATGWFMRDGASRGGGSGGVCPLCLCRVAWRCV